MSALSRSAQQGDLFAEQTLFTTQTVLPADYSDSTHCDHGILLGEECAACDAWWAKQAEYNRLHPPPPFRWRNGKTLDEHPQPPWECKQECCNAERKR